MRQHVTITKGIKNIYEDRKNIFKEKLSGYAPQLQQDIQRKVTRVCTKFGFNLVQPCDQLMVIAAFFALYISV